MNESVLILLFCEEKPTCKLFMRICSKVMESLGLREYFLTFFHYGDEFLLLCHTLSCKVYEQRLLPTKPPKKIGSERLIVTHVA